MAYREFVDSAEVRWRVWATYPTVGKVLSKGFENGWLTFESQTECRRFAPVPERWEALTDAKLGLLLKAASPAKQKVVSPKQERGGAGNGEEGGSR